MIPFNKPFMTGKELWYIAQAIQNGHSSGDGPYTKLCRARLEELVGSRRALLTTSCTDALEMSAILLDIKPGDEVIVPSFTFVSTVNAFVLRGAKPVFADVRSDTLNLDESKLESLISPRTRAIVPVHYAGVGCEMDVIGKIAASHNVPVVEDNAHGLFGKYKGKNLGSFGCMATQSFHETKNLICGEGGALLINDVKLEERADIIRDKGTNRKKYFKKQVDKYTWVDIGSSYLMSDLLAAFLYAQLESWSEIQSRRQALWHEYDRALAGWAHENSISRPAIPENCDQAYHMYYIRLPSAEARTRLIEHLSEQGILAVFHYSPLHLSDMGVKFGGKPGDCPVTEEVSERLLRLPFYNGMTSSEQEQVIDAVRAFRTEPLKARSFAASRSIMS